ncbi:hypothetical protein AHAS_Ahas19G0187100 [Arachis hypogaea]
MQKDSDWCRQHGHPELLFWDGVQELFFDNTMMWGCNYCALLQPTAFRRPICAVNDTCPIHGNMGGIYDHHRHGRGWDRNNSDGDASHFLLYSRRSIPSLFVFLLTHLVVLSSCSSLLEVRRASQVLLFALFCSRSCSRLVSLHQFSLPCVPLFLCSLHCVGYYSLHFADKLHSTRSGFVLHLICSQTCFVSLGAHFNSSLSYSNCSILAGVLLLGFITADHCSAVSASSAPSLHSCVASASSVIFFTLEVKCVSMKAENEATAAQDMQKELQELKLQYKKLKDEHASFHDIANKMIEEKDNEISRLSDDNRNLCQSIQSRPQVDPCDNDNYNTYLNIISTVLDLNIVMVLLWNIHFRGGLAWEATNKNLIFNEEIEELERENPLHSQQVSWIT